MRSNIFLVLTVIIVLSLALAGFGCKSAASTNSTSTTASKTSITAVSTATSTSASTSTTTTANSKAPVATIKIGVLQDVSGAYSYYGQAFLEGTKVAIQMVNDAGGIKSLGGAKIEPVYGVGDSSVPTMLKEMERLITVEHVVAIVGPTITAEFVAAAPVAERYQIPIIGGPNVEDLFNKGYKYVFSTGVPGTNMGTQQVNFMDWLIKNYGAPSDHIATVYTPPSYTTGNTSAIARLAELGYPKPVIQEEVPYTVTDMTPLILKLKAANVSILLLNLSQPPTGFYQAMYTLDYNPWLITAGAGFGTPLRDALSPGIANKELPRPNHFMAGNAIFSDAYTTVPSLKAFYDLWKKQVPNSKITQYPDILSGGAQPTLALAQSIENAASRTPVDIANAFRVLVINSPSPYIVYSNQYPTLKMSNTGLVSTGNIEAAQWSDDMQSIQIIWPTEIAKAKPRVQK